MPTSLLVQITKKNMFYNVHWKCLLYCVRHIQTENGVHIQTENVCTSKLKTMCIQTENGVQESYRWTSITKRNVQEVQKIETII